MLTIEQQKRLMIFLGECWHDFADMFDQGGPSDNVCIHCGKLEPVCSNIDFTDWRVVGRLIEKVGKYGYSIEIMPGESPLTICLTICAYLEGREGK